MYVARKVFKFFRRFLYFFLALIVLTVVVFVCFNKPKKVNAFPIAAAPVIAGVVAFLGAAGVSITANGSTNGQGFGDAIESMAKDFVFDNKTLSDFYNDDTAVNFIIGKNGAKKVAVYSTVFSNWLNEFADYVTTSYNLGSVPVPIFGSDVLETLSGNYLMYERSQLLNGGGVSAYPSIAIVGNNYEETILLNEDYTLILHQGVNASNNFGFSIRSYNAKTGDLISTVNTASTPLSVAKIFIYTVPNNNYIYFGLYNKNTGNFVSNVTIPKSWINGNTVSNISVEGALNDGYEDFEEALSDAQSQAGTGENARIGVGVTDVPLNPPYTKEKIADQILDYAADVPLEGGLVGGYEDEKAAEEENEGSIAPTGEMVGSNVVLVDGLEDFFPFCIPFDLYELIKLFNVAPRAPVIDVNLGFAGLFDEESIHLDFSGWESAAMIFRILIVIGFTLFLIIKTRDLIRG